MRRILCILCLAINIHLLAQATYIVPNTYTRITKPTFNNLTVSSSQTCIGSCVNDFGQIQTIIENNGNATWPSPNSKSIFAWLQVTDMDAADSLKNYPAGSYAGFVINYTSLANLKPSPIIQISTRLNGVIADESEVLTITNLTPVNNNEGRIGFISKKAFNSIRISFQLTSTENNTAISVVCAEAAVFKKGDELVCNTNIIPTLPHYPLTISATTDHPDSALSMSDISDLNNIISSDSGSYAFLNAKGNTSYTIAVKDNMGTYPAGTFVGFKIGCYYFDQKAISAECITLQTYYNGQPVGKPLKGGYYNTPYQYSRPFFLTATFGVIAPEVFNEIRITFNISPLIQAGFDKDPITFKILNIVLRKLCETEWSHCDSLVHLNADNNLLFINSHKTGLFPITGFEHLEYSINEPIGVIDTNTASSTQVTNGIGPANGKLAFSIKKALKKFPAGTFAAFEIANFYGNVPLERVFEYIELHTYRNDTLQQIANKAFNNLIVIPKKITGNPYYDRYYIGFTATKEFDELEFNYKNRIDSFMGITNIFNFYAKNFCGSAINIPDSLPDLSTTITILPAIAHGITEHNMTVAIHEINGKNAAPPVTVYITKDDKITLQWDPQKQITDNNTPINNRNWSLDASGHPSFYKFTSNTAIPANDKLAFECKLMLNPGHSRGRLQITSTILFNSDSEKKAANNTDSEVVDYFVN